MNHSEATGEHVPLRPSPNVVARRLDRAGVIIDLPTNRIFELNETGIRIWELVAEGHPLAAVARHLAEEFDVDADAAARNVEQFVDRFRREGLLA